MIGRTRIKICGITRGEDAALAIDLGADALGFVLWPKSPRAVSAERVRAITRALPPLTIRVGVFVNASPTEMASVAETAGLDVLQLHGEEPVVDGEHAGRRLIRSVQLVDERAVRAAASLPANILPLVDAVDAERRGGTGRTADWTRAAELSRVRRIVLAGGLTPENVAAAIRHVRPWAVDVSSGVERAPGVKDPDRLRAFFASVADARVEGE